MGTHLSAKLRFDARAVGARAIHSRDPVGRRTKQSFGDKCVPKLERLCENSFPPEGGLAGCAAMSFILGVDRSQTLLLPESVEEYVSAEHPVRFLDAFVDGLDLAACGFARTEPADTGRPPFAPADLLKLYLWGYLNKVRSSRRLELECGRNLEVLWLPALSAVEWAAQVAARLQDHRRFPPG